MLRRVAPVGTDVLEKHIASIMSVTKIGELYIVFLRSVLLLLVTANVVPSSQTLVTVILEAIHSSETSVLTRATRCNISDDGILHTYRRENLKSYIALTGWAL
jgi:hypothetical protein